MSEREIIPGSKMVWHVIGWSFLFSFLFNIVYSFLYNIISSATQNLIVICIIAIILNGIFNYFTWKISVSTAFRSRTIASSDLNYVTKGILIFAIVIVALYCISNFLDMNESVEKLESQSLGFSDYYAETYLSDSELIEYQQERNAIIEDAKSQIYGYSIFLTIAVSALYIFMAFVANRMIAKQCQDENYIVE